MASRQERGLAGNGARMIAVGAPFVVVGIVLLATAGTEQHARKDRPFA